MTTRTNEAQAVDPPWRARGAIGAKRVDAALAHDAPEPVVYSMAPPSWDVPGREAMSGWSSAWRGPIGVDLRDLHVTAGEDVAFATSLNHTTGTETDGERVDLWFRVTCGLCKCDGRWLLVHEHEAVPFYMDGSRRAAIDLRP